MSGWKWLAALAAIGPAGCGSGERPRPVIEPRRDMAPARRGDALLRRTMLDTHAAARAAIGEPPLGWSDALAADAAIYAAQMARTGRFAHSPQPRGHPVQGENLWTGTRGAYEFAEMAGHWIAEKRYFRRAPTPDFSTTGKFEDVGHYTQIVWRRTTQLGCALASNRRDDFLVCHYLPGGNVMGVDPLAP